MTKEVHSKIMRLFYNYVNNKEDLYEANLGLDDESDWAKLNDRLSDSWYAFHEYMDSLVKE